MKLIRCECGYVARGDGDDQVVGLIRGHMAADHPALRDPDAAFWKETAPAIFRVRIETTKGPFVLEVRREWAPIGADRFYNLVRSGFYDDSRFYRVTTRFARGMTRVSRTVSPANLQA